MASRSLSGRAPVWVHRRPQLRALPFLMVHPTDHQVVPAFGGLGGTDPFALRSADWWYNELYGMGAARFMGNRIVLVCAHRPIVLL